VRRAAALVFDRAVPVQREGFERFQDLPGAARNAARVKILHPHEPAAAVAAGIEEARACRQERAQVQ